MPAPAGVPAHHQPFTLLRSSLAEACFADVLKGGGCMQLQPRLLATGKSELLYGQMAGGSGAEGRSVLECDGIEARTSLLGGFHQACCTARSTRQERHIAAASAAAHTRQAVDAEAADVGHLIVITGMLTRLAVGRHLYHAVGDSGSGRHLTIVAGRTDKGIDIPCMVLHQGS